MVFPEVRIRLPDWAAEVLENGPEVFAGVEERMRWVIGLSRRNVQQRSGGPFAAAVFEQDGRLVAAGVNVVVVENCSVLHAEIMALALAQKVLGRYDLSDGGRLAYELVTSTEPCAMCFGAIPWAGLRRVVCGARDADARAIGFDEGPKVADWAAVLGGYGIEVQRDVLRAEAVAVLREYAEGGGPIYNAGQHPIP